LGERSTLTRGAVKPRSSVDVDEQSSSKSMDDNSKNLMLRKDFTSNRNIDHAYKTFVKINRESNEKIIHKLINIEYAIIEFYKNIYNCSKRYIIILKNQLFNGSIKIHQSSPATFSSSEVGFLRNPDQVIIEGQTMRFVLKISGIWEDDDNIGLTFRFMYE
jgi:hypothetical protein